MSPLAFGRGFFPFNKRYFMISVLNFALMEENWKDNLYDLSFE